MRQTQAVERVAVHLTVKRVLPRVAKVEVMGVDAGWIAAAVQHQGAVGNGTNEQTVCKAVATRFATFAVCGYGVASSVFVQPVRAKAVLF